MKVRVSKGWSLQGEALLQLSQVFLWSALYHKAGMFSTVLFRFKRGRVPRDFKQFIKDDIFSQKSSLSKKKGSTNIKSTLRRG